MGFDSEIKYFLKSASSLVAIFFYFQSVGQTYPNELPGLELWLKADAGITITNNLVSQWDDQSEHGRNATSEFNSIRPELINSALNGLPVVSFDGNIDYMQFDEITNVRTVFWVIKENPMADGALRRPLLGHPGGLYYTRSLEEDFWDSNLALPEVVNGVTRLNQETINGTNTIVPTEFSVVTLVTTGNTPASHITMEASAFGRTWWGELAELIIYSEPLVESQIQSIELYLANKYGPQYTPIPDVEIEYGYCDSTICVSPDFTSYLWSNLETGPCITVNTEGLYTVELRDQFGRTILDSIYVDFPGNILIPDSTICAGENFLWDIELNILDYDISWNNEITTSIFSTSLEGNYDLLIEDTLGCSYNQEFEIAINNFNETATLGQDLSICSGNSISLLNNSFGDTGYLWSTGDTTNQIIIENSGIYSIIATKDNCLLFDTIQVNIIGTAPLIHLENSLACEENSTSILAVNTSESNIENWQWLIDGITVGEEELIEYSFENSGWNEININAISTEGCVTQHHDSIYVNPKPIVQYDAPQLCNNLPVNLIDNSISSNGDILFWTWNINSTSYNSSSVLFDSQEFEFLNFTLFVEDEIGCHNEANFNINILPAPGANISYDDNCLGDLTQFIADIDNTQNTNISSYQWSFGDNTTSNLANPLHFYALAGEYNVTLSVTTGNGCYDQDEQSVHVFNLPIVDFQNSPPCFQTSVQFDDTSVSDVGDEIISQEWNIENVTYTGPITNHFFNSTGLKPITLTITTASGCQSSNSTEIYIYEPPIANFSFDPEIGAAPLEVQFLNESLDTENVSWFINNELISNEENPVYIFTTNGISNISVIASSIHGCKDTLSKSISITEPLLDIRSEVTFITTNNVGKVLNTRLTNVGNIPINTVKLSPDFGNGNQYSEIWNGTLNPANELIFSFTAFINIDNLPYDFICVDAEVIDHEHDEINLSDNFSCTVLSSTDSFNLYPAFPNPAEENIIIRLNNPNTIAGNIQIKMFDLLGREVINTSLNLKNNGYNEIDLDISFLTSGQYILSVSNPVETKSILVLKSTSR